MLEVGVTICAIALSMIEYSFLTSVHQIIRLSDNRLNEDFSCAIYQYIDFGICVAVGTLIQPSGALVVQLTGIEVKL